MDDNPDDRTVFLQGREILFELLLAALVLPFLAVLGEGLLFALGPTEHGIGLHRLSQVGCI